MGEFSIWHWLVVLLIVLLLFGGGKVSGLMGELAKGIKAFKSNMADETPAAKPRAEAPAPRETSIAGPAEPPAAAAPQMEKEAAHHG